MSKAEGFYKWMLRCKSVHLADNLKMSAAFEAVEQQHNREDDQKVQRIKSTRAYQDMITNRPQDAQAYLNLIATL